MKKMLMITIGAALLGVVSTSLPALAQQKTVKACADEWRANKAAYQAGKVTEKSYVDKCRTGETIAVPAAPLAPAPPAAATSAPAPAPATRPAASATTTPMSLPAANTATARNPASTTAGIGQYKTEAEAKGHCPADLIVWGNSKSKVYHFAGTKDYGNTKAGGYMCERDATTTGFRAAKNEKRPRV